MLIHPQSEDGFKIANSAFSCFSIDGDGNMRASTAYDTNINNFTWDDSTNICTLGFFWNKNKRMIADVEAKFAVRDALIEKQGKVINALADKLGIENFEL
jgi:hypothetical protein